MALVVMDAGHGGNNPGAVYQGRQEKDDALALTLAVGQILEESGVEVYYTRTTDIYEAPEQKAQEGNAVRGGLFRVHPSQLQSLSQPVYGVLCYYSAELVESQKNHNVMMPGAKHCIVLAVITAICNQNDFFFGFFHLGKGGNLVVSTSLFLYN